MADTIRSLADILLLLADNTSKLIIPQRHRDEVVSMAHSYAFMSLPAEATTTVTVQGDWYKASGATLLGAAGGFDMPANNRLRNISGAARLVRVCGFTTVHLASGANATLAIRVAIDGVTQPATENDVHVSASDDERPLHVTYVGSLAANSYIEVYVANQTGVEDIVLHHMCVSVEGSII